MAQRASCTSLDNGRSSQRANHLKRFASGFTIVELLVVIVVIAILAAITIVAYNGVTKQAVESSMKSDLQTAATTLGMDNATNGAYPSSASGANNGQGLKTSPGNNLNYSETASGYCVAISNTKTSSIFHITEAGSIRDGDCPPTPSIAMQTVTNASCPTVRTRVFDARDNHSYWVKKLADGKCWMLTNLGYSGGGTNTYGDTKTLTNGTSGSTTYTTASRYDIPSATYFTTDPANPSTSTDGGATSSQYGYLYNWCAAMGGQATAACANATTPNPVTTTSICPAGWRLPTGGPSGEFTALNTAVNSGSATADAGLRSAFLAQWSGNWGSGFYDTGSYGYLWSSTQASASNAYLMNYGSGTVWMGNLAKTFGFAVRCVAV